MKKNSHIYGLGLAGALLLWAVICLGKTAMPAVKAAEATGTQYCEVSLTGCPYEYDGKELVVPLDVIAISAEIQACNISETSSGQGADASATPAIMIILDHTRSMLPGTGANDTSGNRFRVTRALIDSIYNVYPNAEVGMVVFSAGLAFDRNRDSNLVRYNGTTYSSHGNRQSYLPLMALDNAVKRGGSDPFYPAALQAAPKAIDIYRNMFNLPANPARAGIWRNNRSATIDEGSGTNIAIAFDAALEAFQKTSISKENQYIIFLSDGQQQQSNCSGNNPNPWCAEPLASQYIEGENTPTTYTVYLTAQPSNPAPETLRRMTDNIKANGYSASNPNSNLWPIESDYNRLLDLMMENIVTPMLSKASGAPKRITVSSSVDPSKTDSANVSGGNFKFSRRLPVDTSEVTAVKMDIRYDVTVDSIVVSSDGDTTVITRKVPDSLFTYSFTVRRSDNAYTSGNDWKTEQNLSSSCGSKPALELRYGSTVIASEAETNGEVTNKMAVLTVRFDNTGGILDYGSYIDVLVMNVNTVLDEAGNSTRVIDTVKLRLTKSGSIYSGTFNRTDLAEKPVSGNQTLEHTVTDDSIAVFFRNPQIPLDAIRISAAYVSQTMSFYTTPHKPPRKGDMIADSAALKPGDALNIYARVFDRDDWLDIDAAKITWTVNGKPNSAVLTVDGDDPSHVKFMTRAGGTYTVTATYYDEEQGIRLTKTVTITVKAEGSVAAGPNPFVPGVSRPGDLLPPAARGYYKEILKEPAAGGGGRGGNTGILLAATAPNKVLTESGGKTPKASIVIYDAVGNVVFKSKPNDITLIEENNTFGFVWNGKNDKGRTVGPGTYLVRIRADLDGGGKYVEQRKIGVTK